MNIALSTNTQWIGKPEKRDDGKMYFDNRRIDLGHYWRNIELSPAEIFEMLSQEGFAIAPALSCDNRKTENFVSHQVALVDVDNSMTIGDLQQHAFYKKYAYGFYTTPSHTDQHHKFRIVFILENAITDVEKMRHLYIGLMCVFNAADTHCKDGARLFFGTVKAAQSEIVGNFVPDRIVEQLVEIGKQQTPPPSIESVECERPEMTDRYKQHIRELLKKTYLGKWEEWRTVAWGMRAGGFTVDDFVYVSCPGLMNRKTPAAARKMWDEYDEHRQERRVSFGSVIHILKQKWGEDAVKLPQQSRTQKRLDFVRYKLSLLKKENKNG